MSNIKFMKNLESRYRATTGLDNRSEYKLFYGPIFKAPILTLGINPGGDPSKTSSDGTLDERGSSAAASAAFYENGEHDILDCAWRENIGLLKVLGPLLEHQNEKIRTEVVKTNLAFRRSKSKRDIDIESAIHESAPFLKEIISIVQPELVLLTGVSIHDFVKLHVGKINELVQEEREPKVKQVVFSAVEGELLATGSNVKIVRVAHASQFSWTYERYNVASRIKSLL